jgi:hypothetical protein
MAGLPACEFALDTRGFDDAGNSIDCGAAIGESIG